MSTFSRHIDIHLIEKLKDEPLFNKKLLPDIKNGKIFAAIRSKRIGFYYRGGRLFEYGQHGFTTHLKYGSILVPEKPEYVTERMLLEKRPIGFCEGYSNIKKSCALYSGNEADGISRLYSKFPYTVVKDGISILDIEISLTSQDEAKAQDRIDLLLFDVTTSRLKFVEAKHYSNSEIWASRVGTRRVNDQLKRYDKQIADKREIILNQYSHYICLVNDLFSLNLPKPNYIDEKVDLLIYGFDDDQKKGRLSTLKSDLKKAKIVVATRGKLDSLKSLSSIWNS